MIKLLGKIKRAILKTIFLPFIYGKHKDYDAKKYWHDRFVKYDDSIVGPGSEALSEDENNKMYSDAKAIFIDVCRKEQINFKNHTICEIGLGNGFYTSIFNENQSKYYKGYDIADVLIPKMASRYPDLNFQIKDISTELLDDSFDFITLIDVAQHIVNKDKFMFAMKNLADHLNKGGKLFIGPLTKSSKKILFYVHGWTIEDVKAIFCTSDFNVSNPIEFRGDCAYVITKKS